MRTTRRAAVHFVGFTLLALCAVVAVSSFGVWRAAQTEAQQEARAAATYFARTVIAPLHVADLEHATRAHTREVLDQTVEGLLAEGEVYRVKIWRVEGDTARVVYSDLAELEGLAVALSEVMREALTTGEAVVVPVPLDDAHANEQREGVKTLEVYQVFTDADGDDAVVELYLATDTDTRVRELLGHTLPVAIGGPVLLAALTMPLALRLARRSAAAEARRRELTEQMLTTSEHERRRLARLLHDGPVQDLAALSLAIELGQEDPASRVREQVSRLRNLLDDLDPVELDDDDMRVALGAAADRIPGHGAQVVVTGDSLADEGGPTRVLVHRCAAELLRNALTHADASRVEVSLNRLGEGIEVRISDDGGGFDPTVIPSGHHGLRLVRSAIEDAGGTMTITSGERGTSITLRV